jgi:hypothetical protein
MPHTNRLDLTPPSRRSLLRRASLGALAYPVLRAFHPRAAAAAGAKRAIFIYSPNGTVKKDFWPDGDDVTEKAILKPLAPFKDRVTLVRGLGYSGFNIPHEMGTAKAFTNFDAFDLRPAGKEKREMAGPSLDEALALTVGKSSFRPVLRVGKNGGGGLRGAMHFGMDGKKINSIDTTAAAYEFMFGAATGAAPGSEGAKLAAWREIRKSALDVVSKDALSLKGRLPKVQQTKMDAALEAIRSLEKGLSPPPATVSGACRAVADTADMEAAKQMARIIAGSFACDLTRLATWKLVACADVTVLNTNFHNTSHSTGKPDADAKLTAIHTLFSTQIAYLVEVLKSTPDPAGGGSLLDGTVIYWANECAHGNHDPGPLPILLIGNAGGAWKTGRQAVVDKAEGGKYGNLLVSLANAVGDPRTTFGDPRWCSGPLSALRA